MPVPHVNCAQDLRYTGTNRVANSKSLLAEEFQAPPRYLLLRAWGVLEERAMRRWVAVAVLAAALALFAILPEGLPAAALPGSNVTLTLRYVSAAAVQVPRIPGVTHITVPLYPGAFRTRQQFPLGSYESPTPMTPYLRAEGAKFQAGASESEVEAWYHQQMKRSGWDLQGSGSGGSLRTGMTEDNLGFAPPGFATAINQENVNIWFYALTARSALVGIWATKVVQPPRPRSSYLPLGNRRVTGKLVTTGDATARTQQVDISDPPAIARLVSAINRLQRLDVGMISCPNFTQTAELVFHAESGPAIPVTIEVGCLVRVGQIEFEDYPSVRAAFLYAVAHPSR